MPLPTAVIVPSVLIGVGVGVGGGVGVGVELVTNDNCAIVKTGGVVVSCVPLKLIFDPA